MSLNSFDLLISMFLKWSHCHSTYHKASIIIFLLAAFYGVGVLYDLCRQLQTRILSYFRVLLFCIKPFETIHNIHIPIFTHINIHTVSKIK